MPEYRRWYEPGAMYFFTVVTENRAPFLCTPLARNLLRNAIERSKQRWPFTIFAWVLLPDHLHTIWTLPPGDSNFSTRWAFLKKEFTREWLAAGGESQVRSRSRLRNRRSGVWQRRFWEHVVRDEHDLARLADYIHHNPIKHGQAQCAHAWPWSTFHRFVREGWYSPVWCCCCRPNQSAAKPRFDSKEISRVVGE